jgi:DnaK suppressor protein
VAKSSSKRPSRVPQTKAKKGAASKAAKPSEITHAKSARPVKKPVIKKNTPVKAAKPVKKVVAKKPAKPVQVIAAKAVSKPKSVVKAAKIKPVAAKPIVVAIKKSSKSAAPVHVKSSHKPEPFQAAPAVATNLKPHKSKIGLGVRELEHYADLLLAKRRELVGDMSSMEREALRSGGASNLSTLPVHMADMGTDNYEQEFTLGLVEKDRNLLREINHALAKIQNGTYGICEGTGHAIGKPRLEAQPWARFSIEYARQKEKNGMGVRMMMGE